MSQTWTNLGTGGSALNAQNGSGTGVDSNDALLLEHSGTNYVYLPGVSGNYLSVPDAAALDITGDIDIRVRVALDDWTPAASMALVSKFGNAPDRAYELGISLTTGRPYFTWSTDGTAQVTANATAAPTVNDGDPLWVRVTLDVDNAGQYQVIFYTSTNGSTWSALSTVDGASGTTSIASTGAALFVGSRTNSAIPAAMKIYRAIVRDGIAGTTVLDVDTSVITSGAATSFTATTGQTVTINRSTAGRKSVAVVKPVWLLGTANYFQITDNDLLDFGATDQFTVLAVVRQWATFTGSSGVVAKKTATGATGVGWAIRNGGATPAQTYMDLYDGSTSSLPRSTDKTSGVMQVLTAVVDATNATVYAGSTAGSPVARPGSTLANSEVVRIGRMSGATTGYTDMEFFGAAVFRRALNASEISTLATYYTARFP